MNNFNFINSKGEVYFKSEHHRSIWVDSDTHGKREAIAIPGGKEQKKKWVTEAKQDGILTEGPPEGHCSPSKIQLMSEQGKSM